MDARTLAEQDRFAKWWLDVDDEPMMWIDGKPVDDDLWDLWEAFQAGAQSHSWIKITDDPQTLPQQYSSWLLAHKDTGDGSPTVDEAQWDGEKWLLARSAPQDERIYIGEQAYAYMAIPAPPPES